LKLSISFSDVDSLNVCLRSLDFSRVSP